MKDFTLFLLTILICSISFSQGVDVKVDAIDFKTGKKLKEVTIDVYSDVDKVKTVFKARKKPAIIALTPGKHYRIVFSKYGKVSRFATIETKGLDSLKKSKKRYEMELSVSMFDEVRGADYSYLNRNPFRRFKFNGFDIQLLTTPEEEKHMNEQVEKLAAITAEDVQRINAEYEGIIKIADEAFNKEDYSRALDFYQKAHDVKPYEVYPPKKITEIEQKLIKPEPEVETVSLNNVDVLTKTGENLKLPEVKESTEVTNKNYTINSFKLLSKKTSVPLSRRLKTEKQTITGLVYCVQIGAFTKPLSQNMYNLFSPVHAEILTNGMTRYFTGYFGTFEVVSNVLNQVQKLGYIDACIVAYCNGQKITIAEAKAIEKSGCN